MSLKTLRMREPIKGETFRKWLKRQREIDEIQEAEHRIIDTGDDPLGLGAYPFQIRRWCAKWHNLIDETDFEIDWAAIEIERPKTIRARAATNGMPKWGASQEMIDWWMDGLIKRGIPMPENRLPSGELTEACKYAQARGAELVTREQYKEILEKKGVIK